MASCSSKTIELATRRVVLEPLLGQRSLLLRPPRLPQRRRQARISREKVSSTSAAINVRFRTTYLRARYCRESGPGQDRLPGQVPADVVGQLLH